MTRKVTVEVKAKLILDLEEGVAVGDVISEMDYAFVPCLDHGSLVDSEILDWEVKDSR